MIEPLETTATIRAVGRTHRDPTGYEIADKLNEVIGTVNAIRKTLGSEPALHFNYEGEIIPEPAPLEQPRIVYLAPDIENFLGSPDALSMYLTVFRNGGSVATGAGIQQAVPFVELTPAVRALLRSAAQPGKGV